MNLPFNSLTWPFPVHNGKPVPVVPVYVPPPVYEEALL